MYAIARKLRAIVLTCVLAIGMTGCGSSQPATTTTQAAVSNSKASCEIEYEGKKVELTTIHVHETEHDYEYTSYVALDFDLRNLDEKQQHYFERDVNAWVEAKKDSTSLGIVAHSYTDVTSGGHCNMVFEYGSERESIVGQTLDVEIYETRTSINRTLGTVECVVSDLESDEEFIKLVKPLGYSYFNVYGYLK